MDTPTNIYIVVSQTGTLLSRILRRVTGAKYNHASLALSEDMQLMYSFGRVHPYNPILGGFVMESPFYGTFRRFSGTEAIILSIPVSPEQYTQLSAFLKRMYCNKHRYRYNYLGLFLAALHIAYRKENCYYCSEFVRDILNEFHIVEAEQFSAIVKPEDFLRLSGQNIVYSGNLYAYAIARK